MSARALWHPGAATDVASQERLNISAWRYSYVACLLATLVLGVVSYGSAQRLFAPAGVVVLITVALCVARPVWGLYVTVVLTMLGDSSIFPAYPFTKNLSSRESVLYLADGVSVSPVDLFIGALVLGWVVQMLATRRWRFHRGPLLVPIAVLTGFLLVGVAWGIGRGGVPLVAYWELRALVYLPVLFVLVSNLLDQPQQYRRLLWLVMVVLFVNSLAALAEYYSLTPAEREALESLGEHGAAVHAASLLVFTAATWLFRQRAVERFALLVMAVPVTWAFLLSERRAAMVAVFGGMALVLAVLRWRHRTRFRMAVPVLALVLAGYLGAFWNATGPLSLPAAAVKSVVAPDQQSAEDQASDLYRLIERHNIVSTLRTNPLMGVGFGQQFNMYWPLPNISFFPFWQYITHNSILWIWLKAGFGGFVALLVLFATALRAGARALRSTTEGPYTIVTLTSAAFVLMFAIFAYVDIAWDTRNVMLFTVCLAQIDRAAGRRPRRARPGPDVEPAVSGAAPEQRDAVAVAV